MDCHIVRSTAARGRHFARAALVGSRGALVVLAAAAITMTGATGAGAQISRSRGASSQGPDYWIGLSIGYVDGITLSDNASGSSWQIGYSSQIRATLEKKLDGGATLGIAAGFSTAPLTYTAGTVGDANCIVQCQAKVDESQYLAFVRGGTGGTGGLHGMYTIEGGVTQFGNFREDTSNDKLTPAKASNDLTFGFGFGFGYDVGRNAELYATEMSDFVLHKQLSTTNSGAPRVQMYRGGIRIGF